MIGDNGNKLSGGERQRLNLVRALLKESEVYIFDEPTNFLDNHNRELIFEKLKDLKNKGKTVIVITHTLDHDE